MWCPPNNSGNPRGEGGLVPPVYPGDNRLRWRGRTLGGDGNKIVSLWLGPIYGNHCISEGKPKYKPFANSVIVSLLLPSFVVFSFFQPEMCIFQLKSLIRCCCKRKKFLTELNKMIGPVMLLALRENEAAMEVGTANCSPAQQGATEEDQRASTPAAPIVWHWLRLIQYVTLSTGALCNVGTGGCRQWGPEASDGYHAPEHL